MADRPAGDWTRPRRRVLIVAGEVSGDNLAAALIVEVRRQRPEIGFMGVTGPRMEAAGCVRIAGAEPLSVMGLFEVLTHLPGLVAFKRALVTAAVDPPVDLFIGVDAPEFNLSLARTLKGRGIPTMQYVSPQVWAWRRGRVKTMARAVDRVLCLLPFESGVYNGAGLAAEFVGHPLADEIPLRPDRGAARERLGIAAQATVLAILPGSRAGEISRLAPDFLEAARRLAAGRPGLVCLLPAANPAAHAQLVPLIEAAGVSVRLLNGQARDALIASDVVLVASGTATLETLLCKRPMVVAYRVNAATAWVVRSLRLVKVPFFSQPNLLAGRALVPEFLQEQVTPAHLVTALEAWLADPGRVAATVGEFEVLHESLRRGAAVRAAAAVIAMLDGQKPGAA